MVILGCWGDWIAGVFNLYIRDMFGCDLGEKWRNMGEGRKIYLVEYDTLRNIAVQNITNRNNGR